MYIQDKEDAVFIPDNPSRIKATDYNQIKNEIQASISEAGLTPTKDVIQLPQALRILTQQSGAEERALIEQAGAAQLATISAQGGEAIANAQKWASKTDGPVAGDEYSAKYYALQGKNAFPLLVSVWTDHILNDISWLRADSFSWHSGNIYTAAYNELLSEYNNENSITETEGSITFKRTPKGYKIADPTQESDILSLYNTRGTAWYYILDTENTQFKLPRKKGDAVDAVLTPRLNWSEKQAISSGFIAPKPGLVIVGGGANDQNYYLYINHNGVTDQVYGGYNNDAGYQWAAILNTGDAVSTNTGWNGSSLFIPFTTELVGAKNLGKDEHLYFYVGNFEHTAIEQTAGLNAELINDLSAELSSKMPAPQYWNNDTLANLRHLQMDLDYAQQQLVWAIGSSNQTFTAPQDGLCAGNMDGSANAPVLVNGYVVAHNGNDSGNEGPFSFYVNKGDVVKHTGQTRGMYFTPFKIQGGQNNLQINGLNFQGKYATLSELNEVTARQGRWALVGNDTDGYVRYFTSPTDNTFTAFEWANGGADIPTGADYVVDKYQDESGNFYRKYKSGWVEQGGIIQSLNNGHGIANFLLPFANTLYTVVSSSVGMIGTSDFGLGTSNYTNTSVEIAWDGAQSDPSAIKYFACGQGA